MRLNDFTNYFYQRTIIKLENEDCLILPDRRYKHALSQYLSECPSLVLKILNNTYGKDDIEQVVTEFNNWDKSDLQTIQQDSIAKTKLESKLNRYEDSKLSIEVPLALNFIQDYHFSIQNNSGFQLASTNLNKSISYGLGLKYSIYKSFKVRVGWQTDRAELDIGYDIGQQTPWVESYGIRRNTAYISLLSEGKYHFFGGGLELEKYNGSSITNQSDENYTDAFRGPMSEINIENNTNLSFQVLAGFKIYTKLGLRINPFVSYSQLLSKKNLSASKFILQEISAGLIFEYKAF